MDFEVVKEDREINYPQERTNRTRGYGPIFSIEVQRPFVCGLTPFINAFGTLIMGEWSSIDRFEDNSSYKGHDIESYFGSQIGLEWSYCLSSSYLYVRGALEAQYGSLLGTTAETGSDRDEDNMQFGLTGFVLAIGLRWYLRV